MKREEGRRDASGGGNGGVMGSFWLTDCMGSWEGDL